MPHYKAFIRNYLLSSSFYDFIFAYAIYGVLFSIRGFSVPEISLLLAWWALTAMLLEIPSGALADYWSRKKMLVVAPIIKSLCFIIWFFAGGNLYLFGLGFLFWNIGSSLVSGTQEALLYDELVQFQMKDEYEKVLGKKNFFLHIAMAISMVSGGLIAHYNMNLTMLLSVIPLFLSSFFALLIQETPKIKSTEEVHYFEYIKLAYQEVRENKYLVFILFYSFGISIFGSLEEYDQLYYQISGLPIFAFGLIGFSWSVLNSLGSYFAFKLNNSVWIFFCLPFISAILLLIVGFKPGILTIGVMLLSSLIVSPIRVLIDSKIQHSIKSIGRATVTSVNALLIQVFGFVCMLLFGFISKLWNLQAIYISTGIFLFVFSAWTFVNRGIFKMREPL